MIPNDRTVAETFGSILSSLRKERGLTQETLAKNLNMSKSTIAHYEHGENYPPINVLISIADFFGVSTDYMLGLCKSKFKYNKLSQTFYGNIEYGDFYSFLDSVPVSEREFYVMLFQKLRYGEKYIKKEGCF